MKCGIDEKARFHAMDEVQIGGRKPGVGFLDDGVEDIRARHTEGTIWKKKKLAYHGVYTVMFHGHSRV